MFKVEGRDIVSTVSRALFATFYGYAAEKMAAKVCKFLNDTERRVVPAVEVTPKTECEFTDLPVCPACGAVHTDTSDILTNRPRTSIYCEKCETLVHVEVHEHFTFTARLDE